MEAIMSPWILQVQMYLIIANHFTMEPEAKFYIFFHFFIKISSVKGRLVS